MTSAPLVARYTWRRQAPAFLFEGAGAGLVGLSTFAIKRSLGGSDWMVPWLICLCQVPWILSPAVGPLLARAHPQTTFRRLALWMGLPLLLVALVDVTPTGPDGKGSGSLALFMVFMFLHYLAMIVYIPHRGALIRTNYAPAVRGRYFGLLGVLSMAGLALAAKGGGWLLNQDARWLRVVYPAAGAAMAIGLWQHGRIRWRSRRHLRAFAALGQTPRRAMRTAWREAIGILKKDRAFLRYEMGFMLYGIAFLCSIGLLALFAEAELNLSWDEYTWAQSIAYPLTQVIGSALIGRYAHKLGVVRITAIAFVLLAAFFAMIGFATNFIALFVLFYLFGFAMAGVHYGWNLGPLHFAPDGRGHMYAAIHFSMVGIRSIFAPHLGLLLKDLFGYRAAFFFSVVLFLAGLLVISKLKRD